jgi:polyisoprenoid-binding protein YceI
MMSRITRRGAIALFALLTSTACGRPESTASSTGAGDPASAAPAASAAASGEPLVGEHTFVIVPEQSKASYLANEEFFGGALEKYGITAGRKGAVGSTRAIEGRFRLDPASLPTEASENTFTVRMNTLSSDQSIRDQWIKENGPTFNDYPLATFKAKVIERGQSASPSELAFKLRGDLTVREIPKPVTFDVKARLVGDTLTGTATASGLKMSDFGIEQLSFFNTLTVADEFGIEIQFTARAERPS